MKLLLQRWEVWIFLFGIVIVNASFVSGIAFEVLPKNLYSMGRFLLLGAFLFAVVFLSRGVGGLLELVKPMLVWRVSPLWYLLAIVWAAMNCLIILAAKGYLSNAGLSYIQMNFDVVARPEIIRTIFVSSLIGEIVWIGYAVQKLSTRFTPYVSALIVGCFWTAWWFPMVYFHIGVIPGLPLIGLLFNQTGVAVMCAFFYIRTGSALVVLTMQMAFNNAILIFPVAPTSGGMPTYWSFAIFYFLTALVVFAAFGSRPLFVKDSST